jgi:hypothetical protein
MPKLGSHGCLRQALLDAIDQELDLSGGDSAATPLPPKGSGILAQASSWEWLCLVPFWFLVGLFVYLFVLLFDDTPSVFGYAVYSKVSRYGFGEIIMCQPPFFAPSTAKVLLRHRWDCVSSDTRNCAGDNASTLSHLAFLRGRALIYLA